MSCLVRGLESTLNELHEMAVAARGQVDKIYIHWSAGTYDQVWDSYHINITGHPTRIMRTTDDLTQIKSHTWKRNTGAIGLCMACCYDAVAYADGGIDFGNYPPTPAQIDITSNLIAVLCHGLDIPIDSEHVMTHAEAADLDDYGPATTFERWDLWKLPDLPGSGEIMNGGDVLRGKAHWYYSQMYA